MEKFIFKIISFISFVAVLTNNNLLERNSSYSSINESIVSGNQRVIGRSKRIVNGEVVKEPNLYPFIVRLKISLNNGNFEFCAGSLIEINWILTAAHCIDENSSHLEVTWEDPNSNEITSQIIEANNFFIHEEWSTSTYQNDIGLIKLPKNVFLFSRYVGKIQIASDTKIFQGENGTILGYGITESGEESDVMKQVNVKIMSNEACRAINPDYDEAIKSSHICSDGSGEKGICSGDSGGPLINNNKLIGVASFSMPNCTSGLPLVFTRVSSYSGWINKTIFNNSQKINVTDDGFTLSHFFMLLLIFAIIVILVILAVLF